MTIRWFQFILSLSQYHKDLNIETIAFLTHTIHLLLKPKYYVGSVVALLSSYNNGNTLIFKASGYDAHLNII